MYHLLSADFDHMTRANYALRCRLRKALGALCIVCSASLGKVRTFTRVCSMLYIALQCAECVAADVVVN